MSKLNVFTTGSPPHTRGKASRKKVKTILNRITPAHAGKRSSGRYPRQPDGDHPRTRGEKGMVSVTHPMPLGSPPHTRGKADERVFLGVLQRITPAHAGKSNILSIYTIIKIGSPPHTRGKVVVQDYLAGSKRITPAHAGKSMPLCIFRVMSWDHPRTRGEKPAVISWAVERRQDHPRTRGEKLFIGCCSALGSGSPPHTRGKEIVDSPKFSYPGITPAHAGKSHAPLPR